MTVVTRPAPCIVAGAAAGRLIALLFALTVVLFVIGLAAL